MCADKFYIGNDFMLKANPGFCLQNCKSIQPTNPAYIILYYIKLAVASEFVRVVHLLFDFWIPVDVI